MLTSIIIPTFQHGEFVAAAIESALAQTAPVEVIVVDDGSSDTTPKVLERYRHRIVALRRPHEGVCAARNAGLDLARGAFVQFLDADDTISDCKVAAQVAELAANPEAGWCLCDVDIRDRGRRVTASARYGYADAPPEGWLTELLAQRNVIPVHSPLVRRDVIGDLRFDPHEDPEDWAFWRAIARRAPAVYLPRTLARYVRRPMGRASRGRPKVELPPPVPPLRLNLGCGEPGTRSWHPIPGLVNLDRSLGWDWRSGLPDYRDGSVAGVTISHVLMYLSREAWTTALAEVARVLEPGGVVRVTEDDTINPRSRRVNGWHGTQPAVSMTCPRSVAQALERAGFDVHRVAPDETHFADRSLIQRWHGDPPHTFHLEGVKVSSVLFSPHNDDESLFAAYTILRCKPKVYVCYPSPRRYGDPVVRTRESRRAVRELGGAGLEQWDGQALEARMREVDRILRPATVFAPSPRASHPQHVAVALSAASVFGGRVRSFHTYDADGKVRDGLLAKYEPDWPERKRRALAQYESQRTHPKARKFFEWDLDEYLC